MLSSRQYAIIYIQSREQRKKRKEKIVHKMFT
nr:MAG TPA: hypothetical protein [Caudoviricetes sp.]